MVAKRKRAEIAEATPAANKATAKKAKSTTNGSASKETISSAAPADELTIQIVTGSYDRVLHGITATIKPEGKVEFADTFLFSAHTSAIRCIALSPLSAPVPGQGQKVLLASGSTDERINLYNLSAHPPSRKNQELLSAVSARPILENPKNREVGTLLHHSSSITKLAFPTRSKLLSSSEDSTIAVARTRDWSVLSTIKAPIAQASGRPSGDTAPFGGTPSGVNDFAIHPSMKLMISVSKGERCMRLWNLVTGKKAGVLNFSRSMLQEVGEGRISTGEGRRVIWGKADGEDEFAVGFDRDVIVFGMDSEPKCRVMSDTRTKIHDLSYINIDGESESSLLTVSTEDGRVLFFSTATNDLKKPDSEDKTLSSAKLVAQIGGKEDGVVGRIKDTAFLQTKNDSTTALIVVAGSSDGKVRLWKVGAEELKASKSKGKGKGKAEAKQAGKLLGTYSTNNRITCVAAFTMIPRPEGVEESEDEADEASDDSDDDDDDE
ncbi:WD domain-containing protein [Colletotrichum graminicola]|uniref:WD domain-containing protein n=1 Tax=Colletotrichum graminicola (strain M1.001 / M2 / FGSC 10212) TaxID=645133 RepID=E3QR23_COLGM|nr:WD domain-containing protein [Colletotrichum graminicola M1.001]EFQ33311.1 WD domain-containing protein [Colletotrichum graminicola M1.001]WDK15693.1 WD domain-containing protein [Colletotrichum graminicola]